MKKKEEQSKLDDLYYNLYGEHPSKKGQSLERLSGVAFKILDDCQKVQYDKQMKGAYSNTIFQIDALLGEGEQQVMVEAKDYSVRNKPVGRGDLTKMEGALTDLDIPEGRFVSSTGYSNRAKPYAASTKTNPKNNPIDLYHVRTSTTEDEKGRIKQFKVTITINYADYDNGEYVPIINPDFFEGIKDKIEGEKESVSWDISDFYDADGNVVETFASILIQLNKELHAKTEKESYFKGMWYFSQPVYINLLPLGRVLIDSFRYKIPIISIDNTYIVDSKGKPVLMIKSEDGSINKLITDSQLKQFKFEDGEIKKK